MSRSVLRRRMAAGLAVSAALALPASAEANFAHTVMPGESLSSIAAVTGLSPSSIAAASGLSPDALLIAGSVVQIPPQTLATRAVAPASPATGSSPAPAAPAAGTAAPPPLGAYTVRPGDTLSGLAAGARIPLEQFAQMNGLDPDAPLLAGTVVKLPTGAPAPVRSSEPAPATERVPAAAPAPTPGHVTSADIAAVATRNGVDASLASAIAWQESGFNNAMVSAANARGVMQVMPGTWDWVQANLARRHLDPASPIDNVGAGVLYLGSLLRETGNPATAAAAYYQGLSSVQRIGMLPETQRYVANVMALRHRFGG